jgi:uncharacterized protein YecT (DUF1311 family)
MRYSVAIVTEVVLLVGLIQPCSALNCRNPATQPEINECASIEARNVDEKLNNAYKELLRNSGSDERHALTEAQNAWTVYRLKSCQLTSLDAFNLSIYALVFATCLRSMALERISELAKLNKCAPGDIAC